MYSFMKKKGGADLITGNVIFLILNILFFSVVFTYIMTSSESVNFYEELYSKQVASMIDASRPGTTLILNMGKFYDVFERDIEAGKIREEDFLSIDSKNKKVSFSFLKNNPRIYSQKFLNDVQVDYKVQGVFLILEIKEKE